ncbi:MAG TPA: TolC family protein [Gammaproteobacteria bacterium]|jgi:outer membrane protein TolC
MRRKALVPLKLVVGAALPIICAACQHVPPAPIDPAANGARIAARSLADPLVHDALARHDLPLSADQTWSLDQLTLAAWTLRTDLAVARSEVDAARAATGVASQRRNPSVTTTTEKVFDPDVDSPWVIGAALALNIEPGGKREIRRDRALAQEQALEWQFGEALWSARAEVRKALLDLALARELAALDSEQAQLARAFLAWVMARFEHGAATISERLAAVRAVSESESRRELDNAALATAAARLAAAIGVAPSEVAGVRPAAPLLPTLPAIAAEELNTARDLALVNRLDVRRALAEYEIAEQDLRAAVASQYPDLTLAPGYLVDQADHKITLGLDLPVPLFHDASAAIRRAIADRAVAAAKFDEVQAAAFAAIEIGFAQYQSSRNALEAVLQAERDAADAVTSLERRIAAGGANRGELLAGQLALIGLRRNVLEARRAALEAATLLENGIERPLFPASSLEPAGAIRELLVEVPQ